MLDFIIRNVRIIDGSGDPLVRADAGIEDGRIARVGDLAGIEARGVVNAEGACLAPGFIDMHTHSDFFLPKFPRSESMVAQGVTTEVTGNCGLTPYPVVADRRDLIQKYTEFLGPGLAWDWLTAGEYMKQIEALPLAHNVAFQVGHGSVRVAAMGFDNRAPTASELATMEKLVAQAFEDGVFGFSTGLIYSPGAYAETDELVALAKVAGRYGGFYSTHMRNEGAGLESSVAEALEIGRAGGLPVQISHHKAMGEKNWGAIERTLAMADEARAAGQDVTLDQYPYTGASTTFTAFLPIESLAGGVDGLMGRLEDGAERRRISDFADANKPMGWDKVVVASVSKAENKRFEGKTIADVGDELDLPAVDAGLELLQREGGPFSIIRFGMSEADVNRVMRDPNVMVASDGHGMNPAAGSRPHPRSYGTFVRVLGKYVREEGNLALEEAVRKMTSLPARRLGLADRGLIRPGYVADMVLFRPESVQEEATFEEPHHYATGVDRVWVGGVEVWREGKDTGAVAGRSCGGHEMPTHRGREL